MHLRPGMMLRKYSLIALLFTAPLLHGQTAPATPGPVWATIASESTSISVTLPAGTTYRLGDYANNRWSDPVTVTAPTTISPMSMSGGDPFPFSDPDQGTVKELDVLETTAPQTIAVTNLATSPATTVSQIVPPTVPPTAVPVAPGTTYTLTFSNFATSPTAGQNALMLGRHPNELDHRRRDDGLHLWADLHQRSVQPDVHRANNTYLLADKEIFC
jgi:hypothetical protein